MILTNKARSVEEGFYYSHNHSSSVAPKPSRIIDVSWQKESHALLLYVIGVSVLKKGTQARNLAVQIVLSFKA